MSDKVSPPAARHASQVSHSTEGGEFVERLAEGGGTASPAELNRMAAVIAKFNGSPVDDRLIAQWVWDALMLRKARD